MPEAATPKHQVESTHVSSSRTFAIVVTGFANRPDYVYVFQEGRGGCSDLQGELEYSHDAQQHYYRNVVHGQFRRTTRWSAFLDAGRHWACTYLADRSGTEILHKFAPFTIGAPPVGRLDLYPPKHSSVGQRYAISLKGFAARTDSLWIYVQRQAAGRCLGWYAFYDSTYGHRHPIYDTFVVHGHFSKPTHWQAARTGGYRACAYLAETAAYPARIVSRAGSYRIRGGQEFPRALWPQGGALRWGL